MIYLNFLYSVLFISFLLGCPAFAQEDQTDIVVLVQTLTNQPCKGQSRFSFDASASWQCETISRNSSQILIERSGEVGASSATARIRATLQTDNSPNLIIGSSQVTVRLLARNPGRYYDISAQHEAQVSVERSPSIDPNSSCTGAVLSIAYMNGSILGLGEWRTSVVGCSGSRSQTRNVSSTRRSSTPGIRLADGRLYYQIAEATVFIRIDTNKANAKAESMSTVRFTWSRTSWLSQGGTGIGNGGTISVQCTNSPRSATASIVPRSGNAIIRRPDPVATRGYPLANNVYINSQSRFPSLRTPMGFNASFTYGIAIRESSDGSRYLIDEDGTEINFGALNQVPKPEAGVYSQLTRTESGWILEGAGAPGRLHTAGNFSYTFDASGRLHQLIDPSSNIQQLQYNDTGLLTEVVDINTKKTIRFDYNRSGLVSRIVENGGAAVSELSYERDRLTEIRLIDSIGKELTSLRYSYDSTGRLGSVVSDRNPNSTISFTYQQIAVPGSTARASMSWGRGSTAGSISTDYFQPGTIPNSTRVSVKNDQGGESLYEFDPLGNLVRIKRPKLRGANDAPVTSFTFDSNRNPISVSDGLTVLSFEYNHLGKVTKVSDAAGGEWTMTYQGVDIQTLGDALGALYVFGYEDPQNAHSPTLLGDAAGNVWRYSYNAFGQILSVTPPPGSPTGITQYTYDEDPDSATLGYLKAIQDGTGQITTFDSYSVLGDLTSITVTPREGTARTTRFEYDGAQRLVKAINSDGTASSAEYAGRFLAQTVDEEGRSTKYGFCQTCGALERIEAPLGKILRVTHTGDHDVSAFIDARNKQTRYTYGDARELTRVTYPGSTNTVHDFFYDSTGRLSATENGRNQRSAFVYDSAGRLVQQSFSGGTPLATQAAIAWKHRLDGRVLSMQDESGTTSYTYTPHRLVESISYKFVELPDPQKIQYEYYPDRLLKSVQWSNGNAQVANWNYEYDAAGRLRSVVNGFGDTTTFSYDLEGKLIGQTNSNGTESRISYNESRAWPTRLEWKNTAESFASYDLSYDEEKNTVGNLTRVRELDQSEVVYRYDALDRLVSESRTGAVSNTYSYDLAGNILAANQTTFTVDDGNRVMSSSLGAVSYDADGNVLVFAGNSFTWDARSKLRTAAGATYSYDGLGRRTIRTNGVNRTFYIFSGDMLLGELSNSVPIAAYTWGADGLVSARRLDSQRSLFYHFGPQGETRQLTDSSGTVSIRYQFDPYGQPVRNTSNDQNPFRYGGKVGYYTDGENILAGARWYNPRLMRWLSRDPIGYRGGDNLYGYADANPIRKVDPRGTLTVYIWYPSRRVLHGLGTSRVGHASIALNDGRGYISMFPTDSKGYGLYSPSNTNRDFFDDILAYKALPDRIIRVNGLDEDAIAEWWQNARRQWYGGLHNNCSNVVYRALQVGLGNADPGFDFWTPLLIEECLDNKSCITGDQ